MSRARITGNIRQARPSEAPRLSHLAFRSKAYWGYDDAFMNQCRDELSLSPAYIETNEVWVLEAGGQIAGFYAIAQRGQEASLDALFIEPASVRRGYGKALWQHAVQTAQQSGVHTLSIDSDPNAEAFYKAMGAVLVGQVPSGSIPGRLLPLLRFSLSST
ncbi:MAG: GNAT family N-acetyltransferase [Symbiobacteriia bacterium]